MSTNTTTTTRRSLTDRLDDTEEAVSSRAADLASAWARRASVHAIHVTVFLVLVVNRDHTVLALLRWLQRVAGTAMGGVPANLLSVLAQSHGGFWSVVGPHIGL